MKNKKLMLLLSLVLVFALCLTFAATAWAADGDEGEGGQTSGDTEKMADKIVKPNGDGTYTIALSVTGDARKDTKITPTNVIFILDASNSMYLAQNNVTVDGVSMSRMAATLNSMEGVAQALLSKNGKGGNPDDAIEVALIVFSGSTQTAIELEPTNSYNDFYTEAETWRPNHPDNHGTSWSTALGLVDDVNFGEGDTDQTFVIFFTDGAPTTDGPDFDTPTEYANSLEPAKKVVDKVADGGLGYTMYSIFAFGNGENYLRQLTNYAYTGTASTADSEYFYPASNAAALQQAFDNILEKIELAGIANVNYDDGASATVQNAETTTKVMDLIEVVDGSYQYYRRGGHPNDDPTQTGEKYNSEDNEGLGEAWTPPTACQARWDEEKGSVIWDLSEINDTGVKGLLEDDVTYTVTFRCAPSQEAMDLVTDLKNHPEMYDELKEAEDPRVEYIQKNTDAGGNVSYSVFTNSSVDVTYIDTRDDTPTPQHFTDVDPQQPAPVTPELISIEKSWYGSYNGEEGHEKVKIGVMKDGDDKKVEAFELTKSQNKHSAEIYISTGVMTVTTTDDGTDVEIIVPGHDFQMTENIPDSTLTYHWELQANTMHPMLINNKIKMLLLAEKDPADAAADAIYYKESGENGKTYYKINGKWYEESSADAKLTGANYRRSNLNLTKAVEGPAPEGAKFEFTMKLTAPKDALPADQVFWFAVKEGPNENDPFIAQPDVETEAIAEIGRLYPDNDKITNIKFHSKDDSDAIHDYNYVTYDYDGSPNDYPATSAYDTIKTDDNGRAYYEYYTNYFYFDSGNPVKVTLQDGWNLRFTNVLTGTEYDITETVPTGYKDPLTEADKDITVTPDDNATEDEEPAAGGDAGEDEEDEEDEEEKPAYTITDNRIVGNIIKTQQDYVVTFTNTYQMGAIEITKTVKLPDGADIDDADPKALKFTVKGPAPTDPQGTQFTASATLEDFKQKEDQAAAGGNAKAATTLTYVYTVPGLTEAGEYTITEEDTGFLDGYVLKDGTTTTAKAKVTLGATATATFNNEYEANVGTLKITKTLTGLDELPTGFTMTVAPATQEQEPAATLRGEGASTNITLTYTKGADNPFTVSQGTVAASGTETVTGFVWTITGLAPGVYTIDEGNGAAPEGYELTDYTITVTPPSGYTGEMNQPEVVKSKETSVAVNNVYDRQKGTLVIAKQIQGLPEGSTAKPNDISITVTEKDNTSNSFTLTTTSADTYTFDADNWTWTVTNVYVGTYTVEEATATATIDGYNLNVEESTTSGEANVTKPAVVQESNAATATTPNFTLVNVYEPKQPSLKVTKTPSKTTNVHAGETITYTVIVENDGEVAITNIVAKDDLTGDEWTIDELTPGAKDTHTVTYNVTDADVSSGKVINKVTATGKDPDDKDVTGTGTSTVTTSSGNMPDKVTLYFVSEGKVIMEEQFDRYTTANTTYQPIRPGYTFVCWCSDPELTNPVTRVYMDQNHTVYAKWEKTEAPDDLNSDDHYAYINGYPDGTVQPGGNITRAEVAAIFFRLLKAEVRDANLTSSNSFSDVAEGQWFNTSISTVAKLGIVTGYPDGSFKPNNNITRAEFATIAARFDNLTRGTGTHFTDIDGHWAKEYIERAAKKGWITGYPDGTFRPDRLITRAEAATLINRVLVRDPESREDLLDGMIEWPDNADVNAWYYIDIQEASNTHDYERETKPTETWTLLLENPDWTIYNH